MSDKPISYIPATKVDGFIIDANVTISSGAFKLIRQYGIPAVWQDHKDDDGMVLQPFNSHGSVEVRRSQYEGVDSVKGVIYASKLVYQSCQNRINVLKRLYRNRIIDDLPESELQSMNDQINRITTSKDTHERICIDLRQFLMNTEALVSKSYYNSLAIVLDRYDWEFEKRSRRPAENGFNALLNYGYAILKGRLTQYIAISGLDIYAGFLHTDRSGRESLILDIIEEFRQVVVDEVILHLISSEQILESDFEMDEGGVIISEKIKKIYIPALFRRMSTQFGNYSLNQHMIGQGRMLASFLRGVSPDYHPFHLKLEAPWG